MSRLDWVCDRLRHVLADLPRLRRHPTHLRASLLSLARALDSQCSHREKVHVGPASWCGRCGAFKYRGRGWTPPAGA